MTISKVFQIKLENITDTIISKSYINEKSFIATLSKMTTEEVVREVNIQTLCTSWQIQKMLLSDDPQFDEVMDENTEANEVDIIKTVSNQIHENIALLLAEATDYGMAAQYAI